MVEYKPGLLAGLISGALWAALISAAGAIVVAVFYSQTLDYYNGIWRANQTALGGMTPVQYMSFTLEVNSAVAFVGGIGFGALIGVLFVWIAPRFLSKQNYMVKGAVVAVFFWLLYELGLAGFVDPIEILSSLAISLLAGYLLGFLYLRFTRSRRVTFPGQDSLPGQDPARYVVIEQSAIISR